MNKYYEETKENHNVFGYGPIGDFPQHFHSSIEFGYILSGSEKVMVESEEKILSKGSAMLVLPYQSHGYEKVSDGEKFFVHSPVGCYKTLRNSSFDAVFFVFWERPRVYGQYDNAAHQADKKMWRYNTGQQSYMVYGADPRDNSVSYRSHRIF